MKRFLTELGLGGFSPGPDVISWREGAGSRDLDQVGGLTLLVRDEDSNQLYLLKEKRAYLSEAEMRWRLAIHIHSLRSRGPVVKLHPRHLDGNPLVGPSGRLFELQEMVGGESLDISNEEQLFKFGAALAQFHRSVSDYAWSHPGPAKLHQEPRGRFEKASFHLPLLEHILSRSEHRRLISNLFDSLDEAEKRKAHLEETLSREPCQPVHGDPAPENVVINDSYCYLVDLDDLHLAPRSEDVAWALAASAAFEDKITPHFYDEWRVGAIKSFLHGYQSVWPLPAESRQMLAHWCVASIVCLVTDGFFGDQSELLIDIETFADECRSALRIIDQVNHLNF